MSASPAAVRLNTSVRGFVRTMNTLARRLGVYVPPTHRADVPLDSKSQARLRYRLRKGRHKAAIR